MGAQTSLARVRADRAAEGIRRLSTIGWLSRMPADFRAAMLGEAIWHEATPGTSFTHAGDELGGMFGIAAGTAEVSYLHYHPDTASLHLAYTGFWAGYRPLLGRSRALTLTARDTVLWALVPQHALGRLLSANPQWWRHLMELSEDNAETTLQAVSDLTLQESGHRAIAVLLRLAGCRVADHPDGGPVEVRISQMELAAMAVMSRNTLNRVVGELVDAGLIEVGYRSVIVRDAARLRDMLDD